MFSLPRSSQKKRPKHGLSGRVLAYFACLIVCCGLLPVSADAVEEKTVRVGLFSRENYHVVDADGIHRGYDYEYLMKIASYTGWNYEFVEGTWDECLSMLERGEIDLMGGVEKNEQRMKTMRFADVPTLYAAACLLQDGTSGTYAYEDFEAFDGMRIGAMRGSSINEALRRYSAEKNFTYKLKLYDTEKQVEQALRAGTVDAVCLSNNRDLSDYTVLAYINFTNFYYATSLARPDLTAQLNDAISQIGAKDRGFTESLYRTYFQSPENIAFTHDEQAYIDGRAPVQVVLYMDVGELFCRYDAAAGRYEGIVIDALEMLSQRTGLRFTYEELPEGEPPREYLLEHPDMVAAPSLLNSLITYSGSCTFLEPIVKGRMVTVTRQNTTIDLGGNFKLAVPAGLSYLADKLDGSFPNAEIVSCSTHKDGLNMVRTGTADAALVNEVTAAYQLQSPFFTDILTSSPSDIKEDFTLALGPEADPRLIAVLNKGIASLGERDIRQLVVNNTATTSYDKDLLEWLYLCRHAIMFSTVILVGTVVVLRREKRQKQQRDRDRQSLLLAEERHKADLEYQKTVFRQANYDDLTGLYNRRYFIQQADRRMREQPDVVFAFFHINIDKFTIINELYGIPTGNEVLRQMADSLRRGVGAGGVFGRLYADQFAICLPENAVKLWDSSSEGSRLINCGGQKIHVQLNVGVYIDNDRIQNAGQAMDYAQLALRFGRRTESGPLFRYQDSYLQALRENQEISSCMKQALREEQFQIYLQPQLDMKSGRLVGAEALVRWFHPTKGMISPDKFIPVLEGNRFIYRLDAYVCEKVCGLLAGWRERGKLLPVSINLSRVDLENPELLTMLRQNLEKYDIPAWALHLEITESAYVEEQERMEKVLVQLREMGFCIEMDDFGSGYSALNMLKDVPVDVLKLDMRFFKGETNMDKGGNIVSAIVRLAHELGLLVIAEGVETEREANFLQSVQCSIAQGFLYGRPMPVREFETCLASHDIGEKSVDVKNAGAVNNLYWKMEKFDILLRLGRILLIDYDPAGDCAILIGTDKAGERHETTLSRCMETQPYHQRIHPDDRDAVREAFRNTAPETQELDFRADPGETGRYERFRMTVYHYQRGAELIRIIAAIRREGETQGPPV